MDVSDRVRTNESRPSLFNRISEFEDSRIVKNLGLYPYFRELGSEQGTTVRLDGKDVLMLGSNSYLGLTNDKRVMEAAKNALDRYGSGCAGSRFLNGTLDIHAELEKELAEFVGKDAALLFSTGFMANQGLIASVVQRGDYLITDRCDHASIIDGGLLCFGRMIRFEHNDPTSLEEVLESLPYESNKLIVMDGVFSMDGDIARLPEIITLAREHNAAVMVDEAHAIGVLGPNGEGSAAHFGLTRETDIIMGTFSKALASVGGFIAGDEDLIEYLKHHARALIFSASLPAPNCAAVLEALRILRSEPERREKLWNNTRRMSEGLQNLGFDVGLSETPVLPILVGDMMLTFKMCMRLQECGVFVNPVVPPAVRKNQSLIRISLMATHSAEEIDTALNSIGKVGRELGLI
ncbi:MAG: pyridoxal phosphate-dependent aminotransferase family protein [Planctomycetota bacterium]|nr:pyridoxal phosphate-dependent aminotransferase family protein [Planctomycetota bacterium]